LLQADVIMDLAGSSGLSWSTNLHQSLAMATRSDNCLPGGANETSIAVYPSFTQKYDNIVSVGGSPIGRIGSGNQGDLFKILVKMKVVVPRFYLMCKVLFGQSVLPW